MAAEMMTTNNTKLAVFLGIFESLPTKHIASDICSIGGEFFISDGVNWINISASIKIELEDHISGDSSRWKMLSDNQASMYAEMVKIAQEVYSGEEPQIDTSNPIIIIGNNGILDLGGNENTYIIPSNGQITVVYTAVLGVSPKLTINNSEIDYGSLSLLGLGSGSPVSVRVNGGDILEVTGSLGLGASLNITFYKNK